MNILRWIAQGLLAATLIWAGGMKLFKPIDSLSKMWPWTGEVAVAFVKFTAIVDLLGAIGLCIPSLTPFAAIGLILLMICAGGFHIYRGEASSIGFNIVFALIAAFIAWGRFR